MSASEEWVLTVADKLARHQESISTLDKNVNATAVAITNETKARDTAITELAEQINQMQGGTEQATTPRPWTVTAYGNQQEWDELIAWVDWHNETYLSRTPPCWPAHRGVTEEFAALRHWWNAAYQSNKPGKERALWHDARTKTSDRIQAALRGCDTEHRPDTTPRPTDTKLIP